jgi:hypothetical protein
MHVREREREREHALAQGSQDERVCRRVVSRLCTRWHAQRKRQSDRQTDEGDGGGGEWVEGRERCVNRHRHTDT